MHRLRKTYRSKRKSPRCLRSAYSSKTFQGCPAFSRLKSIVSSVHVTDQIPKYWRLQRQTHLQVLLESKPICEHPFSADAHKPLQPLSLRTSYSYMPNQPSRRRSLMVFHILRSADRSSCVVTVRRPEVRSGFEAISESPELPGWSRSSSHSCLVYGLGQALPFTALVE